MHATLDKYEVHAFKFCLYLSPDMYEVQCESFEDIQRSICTKYKRLDSQVDVQYADFQRLLESSVFLLQRCSISDFAHSECALSTRIYPAIGR